MVHMDSQVHTHTPLLGPGIESQSGIKVFWQTLRVDIMFSFIQRDIWFYGAFANIFGKISKAKCYNIVAAGLILQLSIYL